MKIDDFKRELRIALEAICKAQKWSFDNSKQRGMAFEDWCFSLLSDRYPAADNDARECTIRTDDAGIDLFFESKETSEVYIVQCKHPKIAASDPIEEEEVKAFFANFALLDDRRYLDARKSKNPKLDELASEFEYWKKQQFLIHFIFISSGRSTNKTEALVEKFDRDHANKGVKFEVWDINGLRDQYVSIKSVEEQYPELVSITLADDHFMIPDGPLQNITFAIRGSVLQHIAHTHKESLYNWNIRRFLGRKGEVNSGLRKTLEDEPEHFYYFNNGISALCETFDFNVKKKSLLIRKLQIVNGAQTLGALKLADSQKSADALVVVKLTAVKHAAREQGIAATLIRTNNTQNTLRVPDFRSNDKLQLWLEGKFKVTKARGGLAQIVYGRKRPYPRSSASQRVLKLQDLGKIRYAWLHDPRIPISDPGRLFQLPEENGLYADAFGSDGAVVDLWNEEQFRDTLLAIHVFDNIETSLERLQATNPDLRQISRLKFYGLKLFKIYAEEMLPLTKDVGIEELSQFGGKFDVFFERANKIICRTLEQAYKEILKREEGTAFSLPRDMKVWEAVNSKFRDNLALLRDLQIN